MATYKKVLLEGDAASLSDATPTSVSATAASAGTSALASRDDHNHNHASIAGSDLHTQYIKADGLRAFTGNQSFGLFQLTNAVIDSVGALPGLVTTGRVVFLTTDNHLYVGTP